MCATHSAYSTRVFPRRITGKIVSEGIFPHHFFSGAIILCAIFAEIRAKF